MTNSELHRSSASTDRRTFLHGSLIAGLAILTSADLFGCKKSTTTNSQSHEKLCSFVILSDIHIALGNETYLSNFSAALADIKTRVDSPITIALNGDITNEGAQEEYDKLKELMKEGGYNPSKDFFYIMGNHDQHCYTEDPEEIKTKHERFIKEYNTPDIYHDAIINDVHFIALGPDTIYGGEWSTFDLSQKQLSWLEGLLKEDESANRFSFVFVHLPIQGTINGSKVGQWGWDNSVTNSSEVRQLVAKYSRVVVTTAHTHASPDVNKTSDGTIYVHDGAVVGSWSKDTSTAQGKSRISDGIIVTVYTDGVDITPRNFTDTQDMEEYAESFVL